MGSSQLTVPLAWPLTSGPGDGPCWALKPLGWGLVPNRYFPALPVSYFPSTEVPFSHSRSLCTIGCVPLWKFSPPIPLLSLCVLVFSPLGPPSESSLLALLTLPHQRGISVTQPPTSCSYLFTFSSLNS